MSLSATRPRVCNLAEEIEQNLLRRNLFNEHTIGPTGLRNARCGSRIDGSARG
ncbi:hypothetical protein Kisp02_72500 [Kineosporia sp. NBRC 101731]|nr:hypothetical protein Kisp02_72500 [Kineosporia sp. NBRC 101731]